MRGVFGRSAKLAAGFFVFVISLTPALALAGPSGVMLAKITNDTATLSGERPVFDRNNPAIKNIMAVQDRYTDTLISRPDVIGTATGLTDDGKPAIIVFTRKKAMAGMIPDSLEGVPVAERVTGEFLAMGSCPPDSTYPANPTATFPRPVPIGVSTGNATAANGDTGTISARVRDASGNVYAMSNNHVYALENAAQIGSQILQPGLVDAPYSASDVIGTLTTYVPIIFQRKAKNYVDAAIAGTTTAELCSYTPVGGYGQPSSTTRTASLTQPVQKYGRTSALTTGTVSGINATITVNYGNGRFATFYNQITVGSSSAFIQPGDSGSLLVTNDANDNPVGLLFAGNSSGTMAVANQIGEVLKELGSKLGSAITIDGK